MARPTLDAFSDNRNAAYSLVSKATAAPLAQVQSFSVTNTLRTTETQRVGDSSIYTAYPAEDVTWELTIYEDSDFADVATMGSTGLATSDATFTLYVQTYASEATDASLAKTETIGGAKTTSMAHNINAGQVNTWTFSGIGTSYTLS